MPKSSLSDIYLSIRVHNMYHVSTPRPTARQDGSSSLLKYIIGTHNTAQGCRVYGTSKISLSSQGR